VALHTISFFAGVGGLDEHTLRSVKLATSLQTSWALITERKESGCGVAIHAVITAGD